MPNRKTVQALALTLLFFCFSDTVKAEPVLPKIAPQNQCLSYFTGIGHSYRFQIRSPFNRHHSEWPVAMNLANNWLSLVRATRFPITVEAFGARQRLEPMSTQEDIVRFMAKQAFTQSIQETPLGLRYREAHLFFLEFQDGRISMPVSFSAYGALEIDDRTVANAFLNAGIPIQEEAEMLGEDTWVGDDNQIMIGPSVKRLISLHTHFPDPSLQAFNNRGRDAQPFHSPVDTANAQSWFQILREPTDQPATEFTAYVLPIATGMHEPEVLTRWLPPES